MQRAIMHNAYILNALRTKFLLYLAHSLLFLLFSLSCHVTTCPGNCRELQSMCSVLAHLPWALQGHSPSQVFLLHAHM